MSATPFDLSRRSAIMQKGHTPVEYISTLAIALLLHREARLLPRRDAALQLVHRGETRGLEKLRRPSRARAALARHDHGLFLELADLLDALAELRERNVAGSRQVSRRVLVAVAHVEDERRALVHEPRRFKCSDFARRAHES